MQYTSAQAGKLLKSIESKIMTLLEREEKSSCFLISVGEDIEEVRPEYDMEKVQKEIEELQRQVRTVKHAINVFNTTHTLPGYDDLTIDQALIYIPQLTAKMRKFKAMASRLPRERMNSFRSNLVEYSISNYDVAAAEEAYEKARSELTKMQLALDEVNSTETMEINI